MTSAELLLDSYSRIRGIVHRAVDGLKPEQLSIRVERDANSIAWLVWHLARVQDSHLAEATGDNEVWTSAGWAERFSLPFDHLATGFGQSSSEVGQVQVDSVELLLGYFDAVEDKTMAYVAKLTDDDLDRIVDESWDPHVSLGVRLVSVIADNIQHAGQAAFVRGMIDRQ